MRPTRTLTAAAAALTLAACASSVDSDTTATTTTPAATQPAGTQPANTAEAATTTTVSYPHAEPGYIGNTDRLTQRDPFPIVALTQTETGHWQYRENVTGDKIGAVTLTAWGPATGPVTIAVDRSPQQVVAAQGEEFLTFDLSHSDNPHNITVTAIVDGTRTPIPDDIAWDKPAVISVPAGADTRIELDDGLWAQTFDPRTGELDADPYHQIAYQRPISIGATLNDSREHDGKTYTVDLSINSLSSSIVNADRTGLVEPGTVRLTLNTQAFLYIDGAGTTTRQDNYAYFGNVTVTVDGTEHTPDVWGYTKVGGTEAVIIYDNIPADWTTATVTITPQVHRDDDTIIDVGDTFIRELTR